MAAWLGRVSEFRRSVWHPANVGIDGQRVSNNEMYFATSTLNSCGRPRSIGTDMFVALGELPPRKTNGKMQSERARLELGIVTPTVRVQWNLVLELFVFCFPNMSPERFRMFESLMLRLCIESV